jgi:hypothetical protein
MPKITISKEDLLRGKVLDPGWYAVSISDVQDKTSKKGDSINTTVFFDVIQEGPFTGCKLFRLFNEKAPGFAIPFIEAITGKKLEEEGTYDLKAAIGRQIMVYVKNEIYEGAMQNRVEGFRPMA